MVCLYQPSREQHFGIVVDTSCWVCLGSTPSHVTILTRETSIGNAGQPTSTQHSAEERVLPFPSYIVLGLVQWMLLKNHHLHCRRCLPNRIEFRVERDCQLDHIPSLRTPRVSTKYYFDNCAWRVAFHHGDVVPSLRAVILSCAPTVASANRQTAWLEHSMILLSEFWISCSVAATAVKLEVKLPIQLQ